MVGLRKACDSKFLDKSWQEAKAAFRRWAEGAEAAMLITRLGYGKNIIAQLRRGMVAWQDFTHMSMIFNAGAGLGDDRAEVRTQGLSNRRLALHARAP